MKMTVIPWETKPRKRLEELAALLGGQNGRRLVEDDDPGAAGEHLEDLDPLLDADREQTDALGRVDLEPEFAGETLGLPDLCTVVDEDAASDLHAEEDVLGDGQRGHQLEMLVDHAEAGSDRGTRIGDDIGLPSMTNLAFVGLEQPEQDVHQRGLAGAVFADDGVNLAGPNRQVDPIVGDKRPKALGHPFQLNRVAHNRPAAAKQTCTRRTYRTAKRRSRTPKDATTR